MPEDKRISAVPTPRKLDSDNSLICAKELENISPKFCCSSGDPASSENPIPVPASGPDL